MSSKNPDIAARLRAHPAILRRRSPALIWTGAALALIILALWVWLMLDAAAVTADFASHQDTAVTVNQRVSSRFGVLIGVIVLPLLALSAFTSFWFFSSRYQLRVGGARLKRSFRGVFSASDEQGAAFQNNLRTRDLDTIGTIHSSVEKGNFIVEAWHCPDDRIGWVGAYSFALRQDPGWELVEFSGPNYPAFALLFGRQSAPQQDSQ